MITGLKNIPGQPGVYKFKDIQNKLLYIGKAKNLNHRVRSYFVKNADLSPAKQLMVQQIKKIEYTIVNNETEALLLEATLIKKYQPPFNIDLKDDKSWLYIKITDGDFPQVVAVRKINDNKKNQASSAIHHKLPKYFGPYTSAVAVRYSLKLLRKIFPYFSQRGPMVELGKKTGSPYHLGRYLSQQLITQTEWQKTIWRLNDFLSGKTQKVRADLKTKMDKASLSQAYEKAAALRDQLNALNRLAQNQQVVSAKKINEDYLNLFTQANLAVITLFKVREGRLLDQQNFTLKNVRLLNDQEILEQFAGQYYGQTADRPKTLIVPQPIFSEWVKTVKAQKGGRKKLLDLALTNAKHHLRTQLASWEKKVENGRQASAELKKIFKLKSLERMEAYDISNIQGAAATGSMVVFTNGQPDKNEYRRFAIKTVKGINDPAMMAEVIKRRLRHQDWRRPDLIVIDGGPTQLNAARKFSQNVPIISLAKRQEEIYLPGSGKPLRLSKRSPALQLLQRLRDEAHRFAVNYHRKLRNKKVFK